MHIGFRTSQGRGEYEVVGSHTGYRAADLEGFTFQLKWPDGIVRETDLELEPASSGKPRLRSTRTQPFQIGRMIASMLMLPDPIRARDQAFAALPVARHKGYFLTRVGFGPDTEFTNMTDMVAIDPTFVELENQTETDTIGVAHRWARIVAVYNGADRLPDGLRGVVRQHQDYMASGRVVDAGLPSIVSAIAGQLEALHRSWPAGTDVLPGLEQLLGISEPVGPALPPPDEIGEEETEVSARSAHEYRLAKVRGASGRKFSQDVHAAYGHRCAFCGAVFGGVPGIRSGVDAAHVLAWSKFDLDVVQNGISLCKLHHWAFDAALLVPVYAGSALTVEFTELATANFEARALERLGEHKFVLPDEWLPDDRSAWPSAKYLDRLYADLAISFAA